MFCLFNKPACLLLIYVDMKKENWILTVSSIALIISVIAIFISFLRSRPMEVEWANFLIAILSILVTLLIGWQISNYITFYKDIERKMGKITDEKISKMLHAIKGYAIGHFCTVLFCRGDSQSLDEAFNALEEVMASENIDSSGEILDFVVTRILKIIKDIKSNNNNNEILYIIHGKKNHYLNILKKVEHKDKDEIVEYIKESQEKELC